MDEHLSREEFERLYRRAMEDEGHSYDGWDMAMAWESYQKGAPYEWLTS